MPAVLLALFIIIIILNIKHCNVVWWVWRVCDFYGDWNTAPIGCQKITTKHEQTCSLYIDLPPCCSICSSHFLYFVSSSSSLISISPCHSVSLYVYAPSDISICLLYVKHVYLVSTLPLTAATIFQLRHLERWLQPAVWYHREPVAHPQDVTSNIIAIPLVSHVIVVHGTLYFFCLALFIYLLRMLCSLLVIYGLPVSFGVFHCLVSLVDLCRDEGPLSSWCVSYCFHSYLFIDLHS